MAKWLWFFFIGLIIFLVDQKLSAEPWLSNRYAQNCAACHAPGRVNLPPQGRRCTLSCQGCHVSPQGGGMRSQYGVWNQQRWLRSAHSTFLKDKKTPAPLEKQAYAGQVKAVVVGGSPTRVVKEKDLNRRPTLAVIGVLDPPEDRYDKNSYEEWKTDVADRKMFESTIPRDDPYWLEREMSAYLSGDFRYFYGNYELTQESSGVSTTTKRTLDLLMAMDIGARFKPFKPHNFSLVVEGRHFTNPSVTEGVEESLTEKGSMIRSTYILVDDLPYNSFFQYGVYRPMFGMNNPNHVNLMNQISGFNMYSTFYALGFGAAPNVPFFVVNMIRKAEDATFPNASGNITLGKDDEGYTATLGVRFVTLGLSGALSYWDTSYEGSTPGTKATRKLTSLTAGASWQRLVFNGELLMADRTFENGDTHKGNTYGLEAKYRLWRENYIQAGYALANTAIDMTKGSSSEITLGTKSFINSGIELEILYQKRDISYDVSSVDRTEDGLQLQAHIFF